MQVGLTGNHVTTPLVQTPFNELNGIVSPDGRWVAYEANDSGEAEVYVRPYPAVNSGHWQVSTGGGTHPLWSHNGRELFYRSPIDAIMGVGIEGATSWATTTPKIVVKDRYVTAPGNIPGRTFDLSEDDQRFFVMKPPQIVVVQHFDEELKRIVPAK